METYISEREKEKMSEFVKELEIAHNREEKLKEIEARNRGEHYTPQPFPGISAEIALDAVRRGWQSPVDKYFEAKRKREGW